MNMKDGRVSKEEGEAIMEIAKRGTTARNIVGAIVT